jgi:hypothetical protein
LDSGSANDQKAAAECVQIGDDVPSGSPAFRKQNFHRGLHSVDVVAQPGDEVGQRVGRDPSAGADVDRFEDAGLQQFVQLGTADAKGSGGFCGGG